jgi:hypothetical protein
MRQSQLLSFSIAVLPLVAIAEIGPKGSKPEACTCSAPIKASASDDTENSVYVANCWCPPQTCAATWNTKLKYSGLALACTAAPSGATTIGNCANFRKLPLGPASKVNFGDISVTPAAGAVIRASEIKDTTGKDITNTPNALLSDSSKFVLNGIATRLEIIYSSGLKGGFIVEWFNANNDFGRANPTGIPEQKILTATVRDPAGFSEFFLGSTEIYIHQVCAYFDSPLSAATGTAPKGRSR